MQMHHASLYNFLNRSTLGTVLLGTTFLSPWRGRLGLGLVPRVRIERRCRVLARRYGLGRHMQGPIPFRRGARGGILQPDDLARSIVGQRFVAKMPTRMPCPRLVTAGAGTILLPACECFAREYNRLVCGSPKPKPPAPARQDHLSPRKAFKSNKAAGARTPPDCVSQRSTTRRRVGRESKSNFLAKNYNSTPWRGQWLPRRPALPCLARESGCWPPGGWIGMCIQGVYLVRAQMGLHMKFCLIMVSLRANSSSCFDFGSLSAALT